MADISVPGLATQTPQLTDSVPGVRASTGLLDCRFTVSALRTLMQANLATVATTGAYSNLSGLPVLGTVAALNYSGGAGAFLRGDGTFAAVAYGAVTGTPTLGNVAALNYSGSGTNYLKSTGVFAQIAYSELSGLPSLGTVAAASFNANANQFLRGDANWATITYAQISGTPTLGTVAALNYPGGTTTFLRADGTWNTPAGGGSGDVVGPASAANNRVVFFDGTTGKLIKDSGLTLSGTNTGDQTSVTGNAGTATALQTARNINGVAFDGTGNITVPPRIAIQTVTSAPTVTPTFADDQVNITAQATALALANPTGTAVDAAGISIRIKDNGTARAISYGSQYRAVGVTLPTTTVANKTLYLGMIFNNADTKWDVVAVAQEA